MNVPDTDDPLPADPVKPSRAATLIGVKPRAICRRIERGQLRAWRDVNGHLRVSEAEVRAMWVRVRKGEPVPRVPAVSERRRKEDVARAVREMRKELKLPPLSAEGESKNGQL